MENQKKLSILEEHLKLALLTLRELRKEQEKTELSQINEELKQFEGILQQIKAAII